MTEEESTAESTAEAAIIAAELSNTPAPQSDTSPVLPK